MEEAKEFFNKQRDDFRFEIPESPLMNTLNCLKALRTYYNLYNDEDKEVIDAIRSLGRIAEALERIADNLEELNEKLDD